MYQTESLASAIEQHKNRIMRDALIVEIVSGDGEYNTEIDGYNLSLSVKKV